MRDTLRSVLLLLIMVALLASLAGPRLGEVFALPEYLQMTMGEDRIVRFGLPLTLHVQSDEDGIIRVNGDSVAAGIHVFGAGESLIIEAGRYGEVQLELRAFGAIPLRRSVLSVVEELLVIPGGMAVGVLLAPEGVVVTEFEEGIDAGSRTSVPARDVGLRVGDVIITVNGEKVYDRDYYDYLVDVAGRTGSEVELVIRREGNTVREVLIPVLRRRLSRSERVSYTLGVKVSDSSAGVGTLTFLEPVSRRYGALGHAISVADTGELVEVREGRVVHTEITAIQMGVRGRPGEKIGTFRGGRDIMGTIDMNSPLGIFGTLFVDLTNPLFTSPIPVAQADQVREGPATVLTVVRGREVESFSIEIQRVLRQAEPTSRGLVIRVTDDELTRRTGGIVQGMSGSPIIQDGRLVGAVTHVLVNDPLRGYGVLAEWMLHESGLMDGRSPLGAAQ